jgi:hypothetical protein
MSTGTPATTRTALRRLRGFDEILKLLSSMLRERQHRLLYLSSSARVDGLDDGVGQAATSAVDSLGRKISEWRQNSNSDEPPTA